MKLKKLVAIAALCALLVFFVGIATDTAHAQNDSNAAKNVDKEIAQRKGVSGSLANKAIAEEGSGPNKTQMAIGIGSCVVMIIVVKWL